MPGTRSTLGTSKTAFWKLDTGIISTITQERLSQFCHCAASPSIATYNGRLLHSRTSESTLSVTRLMSSGGNLNPGDALQMPLDVPHGHPVRIQRDDLLVENRQPLLIFWHYNQHEISVSVTGDVELDLLVTGKHLLGMREFPLRLLPLVSPAEVDLVPDTRSTQWIWCQAHDPLPDTRSTLDSPSVGLPGEWPDFPDLHRPRMQESTRYRRLPHRGQYG